MSSNPTFKLGHTVHKGCCSLSSTTNSLSIGATTIISFCFVLDSLEEMDSVLSFYGGPFDLKLHEYSCCIQGVPNIKNKWKIGS